MAIDNHYIQHDVTELSDPCFSLIEWSTIIDGLIKRYGEDSKLRFDAGYNNISAEVLVEVCRD